MDQKTVGKSRRFRNIPSWSSKLVRLTVGKFRRFRNIPSPSSELVKFSVPLTSESVTSGQAGGVFRQLFLQCSNSLHGWYSETGLHIGMEGNFVVHGADPIADVNLLISPFLRWSLDYYLHAIISTSLIINLPWVYKIYFAVLEEIDNNVVPRWSAVLISCNHSITRLNTF